MVVAPLTASNRVPEAPSARLDRALHAAEGRAALVTYLPVGYPSVARSLDALRCMGRHADILELGIPHSEPILDGQVIRDASAQALASGFRMHDLFAVARELTVSSSAALMVMSYWEPVERFGPARFAEELAAAGVSAVLLPDLAVERAGLWRAAAQSAGLHTVNMVWPHSGNEELARACAVSGGMVYAPATMGVTGTQGPLDPTLSTFVGRLRAMTSLPIGVGIGVSTPQQAAHISDFADAVVVGSALIRRMRAAADTGQDPATAAGDAARDFAAAVHRGARTPSGRAI